MQLFVGVTDWNWWSLHAGKPFVEEVNFWRPSPAASFQALNAGEMFLFKLHSPRNAIAGGGFFTRFVSLPVSLAWEAFGEGNGAKSLAEVRARISFYRRTPIAATEDPNIGCILLEEPFFFSEKGWIPTPSDFSANVVVGKGYDTASETGQLLWQQVGQRLQAVRLRAQDARRINDLEASVLAALKINSAQVGRISRNFGGDKTRHISPYLATAK